MTHPPEHMKDFILPFLWDVRKVWVIPSEIELVPVDELDFLLQNPFWSRTPYRLDFDLLPHEVLTGAFHSEYHKKRLQKADISWPLDFIWSESRLWILDGIHRFVKIKSLGFNVVKIRRHPLEIRAKIERYDLPTAEYASDVVTPFPLQS